MMRAAPQCRCSHTSDIVHNHKVLDTDLACKFDIISGHTNNGVGELIVEVAGCWYNHIVLNVLGGHPDIS